MKKALIPVLSLFMFYENLSIPAAASQPQGSSKPAASSTMTQKRIGIGIAGEYFNSDTNVKIEPALTLGNIETSQSQVAKRIQIAFSGEFGATFFRDYYLGVLVSWRYAGGENTARSPIRGNYYFAHTFKINQYADVLLKPGYKVTSRFMMYGLVGPSIANWTHRTDEILNNNFIDRINISKTSLGLGLGLGFEYLIRDNFAFSADYTHHFYGAATQNKIMSYQEQLLGGVVRTRTGNIKKKVQPSYSTIAARLTYFFSL